MNTSPLPTSIVFQNQCPIQPSTIVSSYHLGSPKIRVSILGDAPSEPASQNTHYKSQSHHTPYNATEPQLSYCGSYRRKMACG
jgi:hypothetical protein